VAVVRIGVEDADSEMLTRLGIEDCAWNAPVARWLVHIGFDEFRRVRNRVVLVEVLAVDQRIDGRRRDLGGLDTAELMPSSGHSVSTIVTAAGDRGERAIGTEPLK